MEKEAVCPVESRSGQEYTDASCHCGEKSGVVKAQLEMNVARNVGHNRKSVLKYINGKIHCRNNFVPFQDVDAHLINRDRGMAQVFNELFSSVFNTHPSLPSEKHGLSH